MAELENIASMPSGFYPELLRRSFAKDPAVQGLYPNTGLDADFSAQIESRRAFPQHLREVLYTELRHQYGVLAKGNVLANIEKLLSSNTFTVTTGQQIHIGLGPLYVIYKALTTIWLAEKLQTEHPECQFVPVFWMASEDHDFDEINHFKLFGKSFQWDTSHGGPVGRLSTEGLKELFHGARTVFSGDEGVAEALGIFEQAYSKYGTLADSSRYLLDHFFGDKGLVVLDPDSAALKREFSSVMARDLSESDVAQLVEEQTSQMQALGLDSAINGRSPNLFLVRNGVRERIDRADSGFKLKTSATAYAATDLSELLKTSPDQFSPNVALRPVYQEFILPNLDYIAGPGEYTFWVQFYPLFAHFELKAPVLWARNSFILADSKTHSWMEENGWKTEQIFNSEEELKSLFLKRLEDANPFDQWLSEVNKAHENIKSFLYKTRNQNLKNLKQIGESYLKVIDTASKEYSNDLISNDLNAAQWQKLLKIKQRFFNTSAPQERSVFFIEQLAQNARFVKELDNLGVKAKWPLSVVWR